MVYLREIIHRCKQDLLDVESIQCFLYYYLSDTDLLKQLPINLVGDEESLSAKGYKGLISTHEEIKGITRKKPIKGMDYTTNIFKLLGIHLASERSLCEEILTDAMFELPSTEEKELKVTKMYAENKLSKTTLKKLKAVS